MNSQTYESGRLLLNPPHSGGNVARRTARSLLRRSTPRLTRLGDITAMVASAPVCSLIAAAMPLSLPVGSQVIVGLIAVLTGIIATKKLGAYRIGSTSLTESSVLRLLGFGLGGLTAAACTVLLPVYPDKALVWPACWLLLTLLLAFTFQVLGIRMFPRLAASGCLSKRIALVGANQYSAAFINRLRDSGDLFQVVGVFDDLRDGGNANTPVPISGRIEDLVTESRLGHIDAVILAIPLADTDRIMDIRSTLQTLTADIYLMAGPASLHFEADQIRDIGASPVINICPRPLSRWQAVQKSIFDRSIAALLLLALTPVLLGIALLIKCTSSGPVLFSQPRLGFNNKMFRIYKFRTMYAADTDLLADQQTTRGDRRITPVGAILRRLSLDELPQLLNVLGGTMSLVGPRPHAPNTKAGNVLFHDAVPEYALRHRVKPGITGWAQVNGWRGETRSVEHIRQRVAYDLQYIENWSLPLDLRILLLTIRREIFSSTAF